MTYALLNINAIKKQAQNKPLEALENKDRTKYPYPGRYKGSEG